MATYKVLQDIEAEDTLIGPLTLRQCIYAAAAALAMYLSVVSVMKGVAFLVIFWLPIIAIGVFFAFPWNKQQPTEVWALAKVRFMFKPRKRIWNQSGVKELVTITAPKAVKAAYRRELSRGEVQNRLRALADTIDSRGWAVKNIDLSAYLQNGSAPSSDRLVEATVIPEQLREHDTSDMFDVRANPVAQKFDMMMSQSTQAHREQLMTQLAQPTAAPLQAQAPQPASYWHMRTILPAPVVPGSAAPVAVPAAPAPVPASPVAPLAPAVLAPPISPIAAAPLPPQAAQPVAAPVTDAGKTAILELANNNDLNIATIAREAQARSGEPPEEVSVSLH